MTAAPYTEDDLRTEAVRQLRDAIDPETLGESMVIESHKIPSRGDFQWDELNDVDFQDAERAICELTEDAVDVTLWSVTLGACALTTTTEIAWGRAPGNWDLAIQVAHRRGLADDLRDALITAIRRTVNGVLDERGIDDTHLVT